MNNRRKSNYKNGNEEEKEEIAQREIVKEGRQEFRKGREE